ncbi:MAG TPA: PDZ domain-containing protein, partial [Bacteroidota bacterium]|nr:PDZ domain-containing protein [Bacteroidota bacterium]
MKRRIPFWMAIGFTIAALVLGAGVGISISRDNIFDQLNKFKDVLALTEKFYVDSSDVKKLTESAINGLLSQLDPHSIYLPPSETKTETEKLQGSYQGVGLEIVSLNDTITVSEPMGGGPAIKLGILGNDRIVKINDSSAVRLTTAQASQRLRGPKGTKV